MVWTAPLRARVYYPFHSRGTLTEQAEESRGVLFDERTKVAVAPVGAGLQGNLDLARQRRLLGDAHRARGADPLRSE
jgi:hypothetical protein